MHVNNITKYYFINKFETNNIDKQDKKTVIIYRNYSSKIIDEVFLLKIKEQIIKKIVIAGTKFYEQ